MIKIVHRNLPGVSNMADQGRLILQFKCLIAILGDLKRGGTGTYMYYVTP